MAGILATSLSSTNASRPSGRLILGVRVRETDNGKTLTVRKGQNVLLALPSNPTTGYQWRIVSTDRTFGYPVSSDFIAPGSASSRPIGSGGVQQMIWRTNGPLPMTGLHRVSLVYARSWDLQHPAKRFSFTVKVV